MNKWLAFAQTVDRLRVFPRLVLIAYGWYVWNVTFFILQWYSREPASARGTEESAVVIAVVGFVSGFSSWVFKIYGQSSVPWDQPSSTSTSTTTTTERT